MFHSKMTHKLIISDVVQLFHGCLLRTYEILFSGILVTENGDPYCECLASQ